MEDIKIVQLYTERSERAIAETSVKYGAYLNKIAYNILRDFLDTEECVSDTYMKIWNSIPPTVPKVFRAFIGRIARNLALDRYSKAGAQKRGGSQVEICLDELSECIGERAAEASFTENVELAEILDAFLEGIESDARKIFVRRYWYMDTVKEIAECFGFTESKVKTALFRTREALRDYLENEGVSV